MEDDIILNLNLDDTLTAPRKLKSGGRWTDRAKANRFAKKRKERHPEPDETLDKVTEPALKKPRIELRVPLDTPLPRSLPPRPPGQIISSLFTSNPRVEVAVPSTEPRRTETPSNAPLKDSTTFDGIGLNPLLTQHLQSKMNIQTPTAIQSASLTSILDQRSSEHRDLFIQSQTGSGKTLAYLLPILNDLLPLSSLSYIDRSIGTLAIIIAPTRELAQQISTVLETLLQMRLSPRQSEQDTDMSPQLTRWLVSGVLTGGATRTHEKSRLRKGIPILVSTPGRLLDHLQNTESFHVAKCRWLVLDEADRLMELGFEDTLKGIIQCLDGRRNLALQAAKEGGGLAGEVVGGWDWGARRRTILCSATIKEDVQKLAGTALVKPIVIKGGSSDLRPPGDAQASSKLATENQSELSSTQFTPPSQLVQKYLVVPLKLRLVTLVSLLRSLLPNASRRSPEGIKIIVFLSCTDSVDLHWTLLGGAKMPGEEEDTVEETEVVPPETKTIELIAGADPQNSDEKAPPEPRTTKVSQRFVKVETRSTLLPDTSIFRLHGSLPLASRQASVREFSSTRSSKAKAHHSKTGSSATDKPRSSILLCTSVASRGLDLPLVRAVVQYDLPTEGGSTEYVHRVGRTARAGKGGEAWAFVAPEEMAWVKWVEERMDGVEGVAASRPEDGDTSLKPKTATAPLKLRPVKVDEVLKKGFGGSGSEVEQRATEVQLSFERWVLKGKEQSSLAQKAFQSHMRAYATHPSDEKHIFHVRNLHIGHLAKAFALRDAPSAVRASGAGGVGKMTGGRREHSGRVGEGTSDTRPRKVDGDRQEGKAGRHATQTVEDRMRDVVRKQGRLTKAGGKAVVSRAVGFGEFQVAGGDDLERLVAGR